MADLGIESQVTQVLSGMNARGGYHMSLVCTDQGLMVAQAGEQMDSEEVAWFTSLFDDIVDRAQRDLMVHRVDEVTLLDPGRGRLVVRPLPIDGEQRFFLVVRAPTKAYWRRWTTKGTQQIARILSPLANGKHG